MNNSRLQRLSDATRDERTDYAVMLKRFVQERDLRTLHTHDLPNPPLVLWPLAETQEGQFLMLASMKVGILYGAYAQLRWSPELEDDRQQFRFDLIETALLFDDDLPGALAAGGLPIFNKQRRRAA